MSRKWYVLVPMAMLAIGVITVSASAERARTAKVGDKMASLLTGMAAVDGGPTASCQEGGAVMSYVDFLVPPALRGSILGVLGDYQDDNARFLGFTAGNRIAVLIAFDLQDPGIPATVYADLDGNGVITNVWPVAQAPALCAIMQQLHYRP